MENILSNTVQTFRDLHVNDSPLRLPNAWDPASAAVFQNAGATAIATTSAGMAWSLGFRDGRVTPVDELVGVTARILRVVTVPVSIDIENGYSDDAEAVAANVLRLVELGVAGINIEDGTDSPDLLARKIEAIRNSVAKTGADLFVNARCDVFLAGLAEPSRLVDESIARGTLYSKAGADGFFLPAVSKPADIKLVAASVGIPLNAMAVPGLAGASELGKLGVRRLSAGGGIAQIVWAQAAARAQEFLMGGGSDGVTAKGMPYSQLQSLFKGD